MLRPARNSWFSCLLHHSFLGREFLKGRGVLLRMLIISQEAMSGAEEELSLSAHKAVWWHVQAMHLIPFRPTVQHIVTTEWCCDALASGRICGCLWQVSLAFRCWEPTQRHQHIANSTSRWSGQAPRLCFGPSQEAEAKTTRRWARREGQVGLAIGLGYREKLQTSWENLQQMPEIMTRATTLLVHGGLQRAEMEDVAEASAAGDRPDHGGE